MKAASAITAVFLSKLAAVLQPQTKLFSSETCCDEGRGSMSVIFDDNAFRNILNFEFSLTTEVVAFTHRKCVDDCVGGVSSGVISLALHRESGQNF